MGSDSSHCSGARGKRLNYCEWKRKEKIGKEVERGEKEGAAEREKKRSEGGRERDKQYSYINYKWEFLETVLAILIYPAKESEAHTLIPKLKILQL